jgi:putative restriction endonuclease
LQFVHNIRMRGYVDVTDGDWYRFLAAWPEVSETPVNFWRPGGGNAFRALDVGEPFFFKTHAPHNRVVGGGFFSGFAPLRASEAWNLLGGGNGVASLERMRERIAHYRREPIGPNDDPEIGGVFIRDVTFFPDDLTFDPPPGFALNIVQGKGYDMGDPAVAGYFADLMQLVLGTPLPVELDLGRPWARHWADLRPAPAHPIPDGAAGVQGRRVVGVPRPVRDHRDEDSPGPRSGPHPSGDSSLWRGEPHGQRTTAPQ